MNATYVLQLALILVFAIGTLLFNIARDRKDKNYPATK